jgi:hypothetical protein
MLRLFVAVVVPLLLWTTTASAQIFYVTSGNGNTINRRSSTGAVLSDLISYGVGTNLQGVAAASNGDVYVSSLASGTSTINVVTLGGSSSVFASLTNQALGLTFDSGGTLYGVSGGGGPSGGHDVGIFSAGGFIPLTLTGSPFAPFFSAQSLRFDSIGNLYVTNSAAGGVYAESVVKLTPSIATPGSWDSSEFADTTGFNAFDVDIDGSGNVFVSSAVTSTLTPIRKYDSGGVLDGGFAVTGGDFLSTRGVVLANGSLYSADFSFNRLNEINPITGAATNFATGLTAAGPRYIAYSTVPEPSQVALMLLGGLLLVGVTVRRNRSPKTAKFFFEEPAISALILVGTLGLVARSTRRH